MNCKYFQDLLVQQPYNELNKAETSLLENHLKVCEDCRAELKDNEQLKIFSKILSESIPSDKNQQETIQLIIKEIDCSPSLLVVFKKIKEIAVKRNLIYRTIRVALNIAAIFLIGLFLFQQIETKRELEKLQSKIDIQDRMDQQKRSLIDIKEFTNLTNDQIEILIKEYDELLEETNTILSYLKINYPEIYKEIQQKKNFDKNSLHNL